MMTDSQRLLADYAANGSERAFQELVGRYVDLVYSTAIRLVEGDTHRAKDVARTVMRGERRRQDRERQAMEMSALESQPDQALAEVAAVLDEAINEMGADD